MRIVQATAVKFVNHTQPKSTLCAPLGYCARVRAHYRGTDKSLARPDRKKQLKGRHFSSDEEIIAVSKTWLDGKTSEFFLSSWQKLEFGRCSLLASWSGEGVISTPVILIGHNGNRLVRFGFSTREFCNRPLTTDDSLVL